MSLKYLVILSALLVTVYCDCSCMDEQTKQDMEEFRKFLLKLPEDHDYHKYPIIPGELSPYVCNCIPKDRTKRKIIEMPEEVHQVHLQRKPSRRRPSKLRVICPYGHRAIPGLNICVAN